MKKLILSVLIVVCLVSSGFATSLNVSSRVLQNFENEFGFVKNVQWSNYKDLSWASFEMGDKKMKAFYNESGELSGTGKVITLSETPTYIKRAFSKKFAGYTVTEALLFEGGETAYYIAAQNGYFSVIIKIADGGLTVERKIARN